MEKLKFKEVAAELRGLGITLRHTEFEEYRVNLRGGAEDSAYYATDLRDARDTGRVMAQQAERKAFTQWLEA